MEKVLVLGINGMLGHVIYEKLINTKNFYVYGLKRSGIETDKKINCDVSDFVKVKSILKKIKPNYVVNCIGVLVNQSEKNPSWQYEPKRGDTMEVRKWKIPAGSASLIVGLYKRTGWYFDHHSGHRYLLEIQ